MTVRSRIYVGVEEGEDWGERGDAETDVPITPPNLPNPANKYSNIPT